MKRYFLSAIAYLACVAASGQIEVANKETTKADQWVVTPNNLKGSTGRITFDNPPGSTWVIYIYKMPGEEYITSYAESNNKGVIVLAPGEYKITLNDAPVLNVPVQKGHDTKLKTGVLDIEDDAVWYLYEETGKKSYTSGNKPEKLLLPIGKYLLEIANSKVPVYVKDQEPDKAPDKFSVDAEKYTMSPIPESGKVANENTLGKGKGLLWLFPGHSAFAYPSYKIIEAVKINPNGEESEVFECSYYLPGSQHCWENVSLPEGNYKILISVHRVGSANSGNTGQLCNYYCPPMTLSDIPIRSGYETRLKYGYLQPEHPGVYGIMEEMNPTGCFTFYQSSKISFPVGKYKVTHFFVGDFAVEIKDGETAVLRTMNPAEIPSPKWQMKEMITKPGYEKTGMGRLNCNFPDPTGNWVRLLKPDANASTGYTYVNLDTLKFIDLEAGKYRLNLNNIVEDIVIEAKKETMLRFGYCRILLAEGVSWTLRPLNAATTSSTSGLSSRTIAVPVGYYILSTGVLRSLIKIGEDETVEFNHTGIFCF